MERPLKGWKILVPRGGSWGQDVGDAVRARGAFPIVAPLINFASPSPDDASTLNEAIERLEQRTYDWIVVTSATAVDVMHSLGVHVPDTTLIAAVGETTAAALSAAGYRVDFVPTHDNSAKGMLVEWPEAARGMPSISVLWLRSEIAKPVVANGLARRGHRIDSVVAYRTVGVPVAESIQYDVRNSRIRAILVTSGSVATQVQHQFSPVPADIKLAAIGPRTAKDARTLGLRIDVVARHRSIASLLDGLEWLATGAVMPETAVLDLRAVMDLQQTGEIPQTWRDQQAAQAEARETAGDGAPATEAPAAQDGAAPREGAAASADATAETGADDRPDSGTATDATEADRPAADDADAHDGAAREAAHDTAADDAASADGRVAHEPEPVPAGDAPEHDDEADEDHDD